MSKIKNQLNTDSLRDKVNNKKAQDDKATGQAVIASDPANTIANYLKAMEPQFKKALPKHMEPERLARIALTVIRTNPKLLACSVESLMGALMQCAQLGLEPSILGHAYLVPFWSKKTGSIECQFLIGYKGMIDLARRSGEINQIIVREVYKNDLFKLEYGIVDDVYRHVRWDMREDKEIPESGGLRYVYMIVRYKDGSAQIFDPLSIPQIEERRARSKAADDGPWITDYIEMAKKTVVRHYWKYLPVSIEVMNQVAASDETVKKEISENMFEVDDLSGGPVIDINLGEIKDTPQAETAPKTETNDTEKENKEQSEEPRDPNDESLDEMNERLAKQINLEM